MILKRDIIDQAYIEMQINSLSSSPTSEEMSIALRKLESMMLAWTNKGLNLGYIKAERFSNPELEELDEDSGISDADYEAVYINLAVKLAPTYGQVPSQLNSFANELYQGLFITELPTQRNNEYMPLGNGDRMGRRTPVYQVGDEPISVENDGNITI